MSTPGRARLDPTMYTEDVPELNADDDNSSDMLEMDTQKRERDPLSIFILYGLSLAASIGGMGCALWGYSIVRTEPFDESNNKREREGYEKYFWGMQSVIVLLGIDILWSVLNLHLARHGHQNDLFPFNMLYDFLLWAMLIAFGVLNMVFALWDRRLCDGLHGNKEMYDKCDIEMFRLLVVELVAVNLGLLVAVLHFILLVGRCCTQGQRNTENRALRLRTLIREEEEVLVALIERRRQLEEENEALEIRRVRALPPLPAEANEFGDFHENTEEDGPQEEENLIDIASEESGRVGTDPAPLAQTPRPEAKIHVEG